MKTIAALSVAALLALSASAVAQSTSGSSSQDPLQKNGSPNGPDGATAKQPASPSTQGGKGVTEGRSANENGGSKGDTMK
jgi:hypothetical protein